MAKIEFVEGVQCQKCGHMIANMDIFTKELCQECGAHIINIDVEDRTYSVAKDGKSVIIKRTVRFFRPNLLEFVREV